MQAYDPATLPLTDPGTETAPARRARARDRHHERQGRRGQDDYHREHRQRARGVR